MSLYKGRNWMEKSSRSGECGDTGGGGFFEEGLKGCGNGVSGCHEGRESLWRVFSSVIIEEASF